MVEVIIAGVVGFVLGAGLVWLHFRGLLSQERENAARERENAAKNEARLKETMTATVNGALEKFATTSHAQLKENGVEFAAQSARTLEPLMKDIRAFREKVESVNKDAINRTSELKGQIGTLMAHSEKMSHEAKELANALRGDSQVIGAWGEFQLKRVLERAGLQEGVSYTYQEAFASEDSLRKDLRTDVLVKMPGDRWVVVDSKNTVEAYVAFKNAADEADARRQRESVLKAVREHVDELKRAAYGKNIRKAFDYSLAYIPFEEVYLMAIKGEVTVGGEKRNLFDYAWENNVILVNAAILLPTLKLIEMMWQNDDADRKARSVISDANDLCDKFNNFYKSYQAIGKHLMALGKAYRDGAGQLADGRGNVLKRLRNLSEQGVDAARGLPTEDEVLEHAAKIGPIGADEVA